MEFAYGFKSDARQNLFYNANNEAVYMTAALGVILNPGNRTQKFFGGGKVANTAKNVANDEVCHTDDITAIAMSSDKKWVASGQVGSAPVAFVWNATTGEKKQRYKLTKGARGIYAIALSQDTKYVACVDLHDDHNVYVYEVDSGTLVWKEKGDTNKIFDIQFTKKAGEYKFVTVGKDHIKFWDIPTKKVEKGLFSGKGDATSFACADYDNNGVVYAGGANGMVYVWPTRELSGCFKAHDGFVSALFCDGNRVYTGGKDGVVQHFDVSDATHALKDKWNVGSLIRAVDVKDGNILVGTKDGDIIEKKAGQVKKIMSGHSEGEAWGLAIANSTMITTGDDNKIIAWDISKRDVVKVDVLSTVDRKSPAGGASTLSEMAPSKCARGLAYNPKTGHIAVGHNDGTLTIRNVSDVGKVLFSKQDSREWIEAISFSPDG